MVDYTSHDTVTRAAKALLAEDAAVDVDDIDDSVWSEESPSSRNRYATEARRILAVLQVVRDIEKAQNLD